METHFLPTAIHVYFQQHYSEWYIIYEIKGLMAMNIQITLLCGVTLCNLVEKYVCYGATNLFAFLAQKMEKTIPLKCWYLCSSLHNVTFQKAVIFN
jgi:hypothetical protein